MKKSYEATLEDELHANFRAAELTGTVARQKWLGFIWVPLIFLIVWGVFPSDPNERLTIATLASVVFMPLHLLTYKRQVRRRIRGFLARARGTDKPVPAEYEADSEGLVFRSLGREVKFAWNTVASVRETDDFIEVVIEPTGIAVLPKRIFAGSEEAGEWVRFIEERRRCARA